MEPLQDSLRIHTIVVDTTSVCNLSCSYCQKRPSMKAQSVPVMSDELSHKIITDTINMMRKRSLNRIVFCYTGGEPLLAGQHFFDRVIELQAQVNPQKDLEIENVIQTNGSLLDDGWASFLKTNGFGVSVSLDGPQKIHDAQRTKSGGAASFRDVVNGIDVLRSRDVEFGILSVINEVSASEAAEILPFLLTMGPSIIDFLACEDFGPVVKGESYAHFMMEAFDIWVDSSINTRSIPVRTFRDICLQLFGIPTSKSCEYFGRCPGHPTIALDGSVYVCDQYDGKKEGFLGNLNEMSLHEIMGSSTTAKFLQYSGNLPACCQSCTFVKMCNGGCTYRRSTNKGEDYLCACRKQLFDHIVHRVEGLTRAWNLSVDH